jgi:hypothetical protein
MRQFYKRIPFYKGCLEQDPNQPNQQGLVTLVYGVKQYQQSLGQPPINWSNWVFGFMGKVLGQELWARFSDKNFTFQLTSR